MKTFRIKADFLFEAEDIDDAMIVLAMKFMSDARYPVQENPIRIGPGDIRIEPEEAKK